MRQAQEQVFLLDSDWTFCKAVAAYFATEGYAVRMLAAAEDAIHYSVVEPPSLLLLSAPAAQARRFQLPEMLRQNQHLKKTPVVWLGSQANGVERIQALKAGADDYISKPVSPRELLAHVKAVLRRTSAYESRSPISLGALEIDREGMIISLEGSPITVTLLEFRLLEYLAQHPGEVFSRHQLLRAIHPGRMVTLRAVDTLVWRLRKKIEPNFETPTYLHTIRGLGYSLTLGMLT